MTSINNLTDKEILEILMTSDFNEELKFDEMREYIMRFRTYYRTLHGNFNRYKDENTLKEKQTESVINGLKNQIYIISGEKAQIENKTDYLKSPRKLSLKERISGKTKRLEK